MNNFQQQLRFHVRVIFWGISFMVCSSLSAQYIPYSPKVYHGTDSLMLPWAGGLNNPVLSNIDLNFDGVQDLFVYEKSGKKILPFVQKLISGNIVREYAPQYAQYFPQEQVNWMLLKDFNCDGKEDIFTGSSTGRMACYKNMSPAGGPLQFVLYASSLKTKYPFFTDMSYTTTDLPALIDVDDDTDLDVLLFSGISTTIEFHRNYAMENYNRCDTFDFIMETDCWGLFSENQFNNNVQLGISCKGRSGTDAKTLHAGSSILALDGDANGTKEVILGDISFNTLVYLTNGGSTQFANMTAKDTLFPAYDVSADVQVFPAAYYADINLDGKRDLIVAPFPENASWNVGNVWMYENIQADNSPRFEFRTDSFLNGDMIDVGTDANVAVFDENGDGLQDILLGNFLTKKSGSSDMSSLRLYRNIGSITTPEFMLVHEDYLNISSLFGPAFAAGFPTTGDVDQDGDTDLIIGDMDGKIHVFLNSAGAGNPCVFTLFAQNYQGIDVGAFATPQLFDVDQDGLPDLICGKENGTLSFFRNRGGLNGFDFPSVADNSYWGEVDVQPQCCTGYSVPHAFRLSGDTTVHLWVGSEEGYVFQYSGVSGSAGDVFIKTDSVLTGVYGRGRMRVFRADINGDGEDEIFAGQAGGGVNVYRRDADIQIAFEQAIPLLDVFPNPARGRVNWRSGGIIDRVSVWDGMGRKVFEEVGPEGGVDVGGIGFGIYVFDFELGGQRVFRRVVLE